MILPILILESSRFKLLLTFKQLLLSTLSVGILLYFIIAVSILRGYGGFKADNFFEASKYVDDYVFASYFTAGIMNNLEISSTYLHSNNVIEFLKKDKLNYLYGETYIKPFFVFIPRKYFKFKPNSAIHHYTSAYDIKFREIGGSYPISIQSELYLNFGYVSILFAVFIFTLFNNIYKKIIFYIKTNQILNYAYLLYMYEIYLALVRGSGLDIFVVYSLIVIFFFFAYKIILKIANLSLILK